MNQYGILQQEVIAIGDNYNDKEMIEFAGVGVAMGNAPEEIKLVADFVTDTNNDDGVAGKLPGKAEHPAPRELCPAFPGTYRKRTARPGFSNLAGGS